MALKHREAYSGIKINGGSWSANISESIISADISLSVSQVNQLTISCDDPGFAFIAKHRVPMETWVEYDGMKFSVASLEMNAGGGEGGFVLTARPRAVRTLKKRTGKKSMKNVSPSTFVIEECRLAKIKCVVQPSAQVSSVSRDVTEKGQQGSEEENNTWSTFNRLAEEIGFICFELEDVVYFGQPTWFTQHAKITRAWYRDNNGYGVTDIPTCTRSMDNHNRAVINFSVPFERQGDFRPGRVVDFKGIPSFAGKYFVTEVSFDLAGGSNEVEVTAETPSNPNPNSN